MPAEITPRARTVLVTVLAARCPGPTARGPAAGRPRRARGVGRRRRVVLAGYLRPRAADPGHRLVVGNLALAPRPWSTAACAAASARAGATRRAGSLAAGDAGARRWRRPASCSSRARLLRGAPPAPSSGHRPGGLPRRGAAAAVALLLFPRPPGAADLAVPRRARRGRDHRGRRSWSASAPCCGSSAARSTSAAPPGWTTLAYPVADVALCAVVLTLGMRQPPRWHLTWACMGAGLVTWAVTDSVYVRLLAEGGTGADREPAGGRLDRRAGPDRRGHAGARRGRRRRQWNLDLAGQLVPYVPVLAAAVVLARAGRPRRPVPARRAGCCCSSRSRSGRS